MEQILPQDFVETIVNLASNQENLIVYFGVFQQKQINIEIKQINSQREASENQCHPRVTVKMPEVHAVCSGKKASNCVDGLYVTTAVWLNH